MTDLQQLVVELKSFRKAWKSDMETVDLLSYADSLATCVECFIDNQEVGE